MASLGAIAVWGTPDASVTNRTWNDTNRVAMMQGASFATMQYRPAGLSPALSSVSGVVRENGAPVARMVRVYRRDNGELLWTTTSDAAGAFSAPMRGFVGQVFVIAFDDTTTAPDFNAQIYDLVVPV